MEKTKSLFLGVALLGLFIVSGQEAKKSICIDIGHGQRFWNNPDSLASNAGNDMQRVQYLSEELLKTLDGMNAEILYSTGNITEEELEGTDLLVLHVPSMAYSDYELANIQTFLSAGGSILLVMEAEYWTTLEKTNVNEIIAPYNVYYEGNSLDSLAGGYTSKSPLFNDRIKTTYQFGRIIRGGNGFVFNSQDNQPFGVYKELDSGGRLVVLGDAMSSLYMYEWRGVSDYKCQEFMKGIYSWLLRE